MQLGFTFVLIFDRNLLKEEDRNFVLISHLHYYKKEKKTIFYLLNGEVLLVLIFVGAIIFVHYCK